MRPRRLIGFLLLCACSSPESDPADECGPNAPCPAGYACEPITRTCSLVGRGQAQPVPDAAAAPDAPLPDAPVAPADAAPVVEVVPDAAAAATLAIAPARGDFGSMTLGGTSVTMALKITNTGGQRSGTLLPVLSDPASYAITGGTCVSGGLAPGASCELDVQFRPTGDPGARPATLSVSATPGGTAIAVLTGTGLLPGELRIDPTSASFGEVATGTTSAELLFTVTNGGQSTTGPLAASLSDGSSFRISSNGCAGGLAGGASCKVGVRLAPTVVGEQRAELTVSASPGGAVVAGLQGTPITTLTVVRGGNGAGKVTSADGAIDCGSSCSAEYADATVVLTARPEPLSELSSWSVPGCGNAPSCEVDLASVAAVTATFVRTPALLELAPASAAFGALTVGTTSAPASFTLTNKGGSTSGLIAASASDPQSYAVSLDSCAGKKLPSGASCAVSVRFQPAGAAGPKPATLSVAADPGGSTMATLSGTALSVAQLSIDRTSYGYGSVATGGSASMTFTVSNVGQSTSGSLSAGSSNPSEFAITSNGCAGALGPGSSCQITVRFAPAWAGGRSGQLSVAASPGGAVATSLSGTGTAVVTVLKAGNGTVSSDGAGISCGGTCSATFATPAVTLSASAASYSSFAGWSGGGCGGTGSCQLSLTGNQTVTATFSLTPVSLSIAPTYQDFGSVETGNQSSVVSFTVTNNGGTATGTLYAYTSDASYAVVGGTCPYAALGGSGATCTIWVLFNPTSVGSKPALLYVNDFGAGLTYANLAGSAYCGLYGSLCTTSANCCDSVPCTSSRCRYP